MVGFFRTVGLQYEELTPQRAVLVIRNRRRVQNHIRTVHASAIATLAESATGAVLAINVPDDRVAVAKSMRLDYRRRAQGDLRAVATLTPAQIEAIQTHDHGELEVAVKVYDESDREPVECYILWVWVPRKRPEQKTVQRPSALSAILAGTDDADIRFEDLTATLDKLGFEAQRHGEHHIYARSGVDEILNLQPKGPGEHPLAKPDQVRRVRETIVKYKLSKADE